MENRKLRIVMTVDPEIPVPPLLYGGIERIVDMLVCGFTKLGHEVHLFANPESSATAKVIPYKGRCSASLLDTLRNALQVKNYIQKIKRVDIVHSFSRLAYLLFIMKLPIPKVQSYQRNIAARSIRLALWLGVVVLVLLPVANMALVPRISSVVTGQLFLTVFRWKNFNSVP